MRSPAVILLGVAVALVAGCGGSNHKTTGSAPSGGSSSSAASAPRSGMLARLMTDNELPGFTGTPSSPATSASLWVSETDSGESESQQAAAVKHLTRLGFLAGDTENLTGASGAGVSSVEQFKTALEAQAELNYDAGQFPKLVAGHGKVILFSVPGIPGARGYGVVSQASGGGANVSFAKGPYAYVVGQQLSGPTINPAKEELIAAARHEYARVSP
jgi:hypothetical protein